MSDEELDQAPEEVEDCSNKDVVTKYRLAADIANAALKLVKDGCAAGVKIVDVCDIGDKYIEAKTGGLYKKVKGRKVEKGIGFPTCVSVNHFVGHFSPLAEDETVLNDGDLVKIDLGVQLDGYIAVAATSFVLGAAEVKGRAADVIMAAHNASEAALRLLKPGGTNSSITEAIQKIAADYKCNPVQGVLSHQMERFVIDGEKVIINREDPEQKVEDCEFGLNEVYAVDIVMSTGDGKPKEVDSRCTVHKRNADTTYKLKLQASRVVLSKIDSKCPTFPFTLRHLEEKKVKFGIVECRKHELVAGYPVLEEKDGELVAHIKFTALICANGTAKITGLPLDTAAYKSELKVTDADLVALLAKGAGNKKKKNKKKKKKPAAAAAAE